MGVKTSTWVLGAAFLAVVVLAGSWFLAISPTLATAQETRAEAQSVEDRNDLLRFDLATLKKQYENLDESKAEMATLRVQIPTAAELADYAREIAGLAEARGATITTVTVGTPLDVVPAAPTAAPVPVVEAPAEGAATESEPTDGVATDGAATDGAVPAQAVGAAPIEGFVAVPIDITALGTTANVMAFLDDLQQSSARLFLVTALNGTGQAVTEASGGRPATALGDLELRITGYIYVLKDTTATTTPEGGADAAPEPLPVPDGSKLQFAGA